MPRLFRPPNPDTPVNKLWNISDISGAWLNEIGIFTYADLISRDILHLWADLKSTHKQVTKLMYYALWGATANTHWKNIPADQIKRIDDFAKSFKPKSDLLTRKKVVPKRKTSVKSVNSVNKVVK
jgi:TfoX C-terminal domain